MKKAHKLFLLISLLLLVSAIGTYSRCKAQERNKDLVLSNISFQISQNKNKEIPFIDLSVAIPVSWDRMYVFGPYTTLEKIDSILGYLWLGSRFTSIESNDGVTLLVFTRNGRVIQYLEFPRARGDFSTLANELGYPFEQSKFIVEGNGRMSWNEEK